MKSLPACLALAAISLAAAGCATSEPMVYQGLASAAQLRPDPSDSSGRAPFSYKVVVNWNHYDKIIVEPVSIYRGKDSQFANMPEEDKQNLARYMHDKFSSVLAQRYSMTAIPGPSTLRLRLTLAGAEATNTVLGPASHLDIAGGVYNTVQAARGKQGSMTGSATYAVEIFDSTSNRLLLAYVSKQYPGALNLGASFGNLKASYVAIDKGAADLLTRTR
ncbi:uncharacterized protein DUF3313 [Rhizobium sp. ERR 922]|uniref:DUF3313 domain-containing protein n=1 Tax=Rhizobium TaxID=379 RepID=UPI000DDFCE45|nr:MULTISPECIES: DUF3313 domain-containing protein [Rhizobium]MCZ3376977.1 DUF3313 domain-containing protein [Rhizobium sp. AG207R]TWB12554.1 uncharacterized protein DUF3313 [Rhizobium sp. ERR1071]TWB58274.1 uncharacterized protein DUF3313 [Rhizobium sp. ERR 922]TWB99969.1 uncharacterized protein DUF3313 [Rhizobium sp. ERR 942]GES43601.1 lipoprotein [Rhizobium dioscoreae]